MVSDHSSKLFTGAEASPNNSAEGKWASSTTTRRRSSRNTHIEGIILYDLSLNVLNLVNELLLSSFSILPNASLRAEVIASLEQAGLAAGLAAHIADFIADKESASDELQTLSI